MFKFAGKLLGQIIPGVMATIIGAYLVQQIFPGKKAEAPAPEPAQATATVMSPTPMAPANKLAKGLAGPPAEPTEISVPNKTVPAPATDLVKETVKEPARETTASVAPPPRRVTAPPTPRERPEIPVAREEPAVPPLELAAKVIASLPPGKTSPSPRDVPEARDGAWALPPPNVPPAQTVSVAPLPPPSIAPRLSPPPSVASLPPPPVTSAPMPITPPGVAAGPPPVQADVPRAPLTRDPVQLSDTDRENLARIPLPLPDGVEPPPRRPSLFERGGALVKGVVSSVTSVLPGRH